MVGSRHLLLVLLLALAAAVMLTAGPFGADEGSLGSDEIFGHARCPFGSAAQEPGRGAGARCA
jgi:hypothetical protein